MADATCPFCRESVPGGVVAETEHMNEKHRDVVAQRLREAGQNAEADRYEAGTIWRYAGGLEYVFQVRAPIPGQRSGDLAVEFAARLAAAGDRILEQLVAEHSFGSLTEMRSLYSVLAEPARGRLVSVEPLLPVSLGD